MIAWQNNRVFDKLIFHPQRVKNGEVHRMLTHGFMHADGWHLFVNMFVLVSFGDNVNAMFFGKFVGGYGFVVFYLLAIVAAIIPTYMANKDKMHYRSLGASGGVSAVLFSFILMDPWHMLFLFAIIPIPAIIFAVLYVVYEIYADTKGGSNVNHSAHLWGAAFGVVATIAIEPNWIRHFFYALLHPSFF